MPLRFRIPKWCRTHLGEIAPPVVEGVDVWNEPRTLTFDLQLVARRMPHHFTVKRVPPSILHVVLATPDNTPGSGPSIISSSSSVVRSSSGHDKIASEREKMPTFGFTAVSGNSGANPLFSLSLFLMPWMPGSNFFKLFFTRILNDGAGSGGSNPAGCHTSVGHTPIGIGRPFPFPRCAITMKEKESDHFSVSKFHLSRGLSSILCW